MDGVCSKTENSEIFACVLAFVCLNLRAQMCVSVLDEYGSRIFLTLLIGIDRIRHINLNAK